MSVHFPTLEEIREKVINELMGPDSKLDDLPNDYITKMIIIGTSNAVNEQVLAAKASYEASSILTAEGDDLDAKCIERSPSVRRNTEEHAVNKFLLGKTVASTMDIPIEQGSLITTESIGDTPALDFHVKEATILPAGQTTVEVEAFCFVAGEFGNLTSATKVFPGMTGIEYVKYVEPIVAGVDRESDDHLRERLLTEVQNMEKGGTEIDYEIWAKRVKGVVSARSIPLARGNGTVDVIITGTVGLPTQQLIKDVQSYIDTKTPSGGADVLVKAPTPVAVDVSVNIKVVQGYEFETVRSLVEEAIREAIVLENKVFVVRVSRLQTIIGEIPSVFTYKLLSPPEDIVLSGTDLAIPGAITVTEVI